MPGGRGEGVWPSTATILPASRIIANAMSRSAVICLPIVRSAARPTTTAGRLQDTSQAGTWHNQVCPRQPSDSLRSDGDARQARPAAQPRQGPARRADAAEGRRLSDIAWVESDCFERGDVAGAARHYREILQEFPNDPVATVMLRDLSRSLQPEIPGQPIDE